MLRCREQIPEAADGMDMEITHAVRARFNSKVSASDADSCWEYQASRCYLRGGYGQFWLDGQMRRAHRVAYVLAFGPIPDGMLVRHSCDNPPCVNPFHLLLGTYEDNTQDCIRRGRFPFENLEKGHRARIRRAADGMDREVMASV